MAIICIVFFSVLFIRTQKGHTLLMLNNYTYGRKKRCNDGKQWWQCTSVSSKRCNAHLVINKDKELVKLNDIHNHPPPFYHRNSEGIYYKIWKSKRILMECNHFFLHWPFRSNRCTVSSGTVELRLNRRNTLRGLLHCDRRFALNGIFWYSYYGKLKHIEKFDLLNGGEYLLAQFIAASLFTFIFI